MMFVKHSLTTRRHKPQMCATIPDQAEFDEAVLDLETIKTAVALLGRKEKITLNRRVNLDRLLDIADFLIDAVTNPDPVNDSNE